MAGPILRIAQLQFVWETQDPFLFCVHHDDAYPKGNPQLGPDASLKGRNIGMDFEGIDGWRMYHGDVVPGFPSHPHRGFETVTVVRDGLVDHCDSLGAAGRYGQGDVQWMTAGAGIVHSEMFPCLNQDAPNHCELFQIWLNLPAKNKMAKPHFKMLWGPTIPHGWEKDDAGKKIHLRAYAGQLAGLPKPPTPPPESWASQPNADVVIATIKLEAGAKWTLPAGPKGVNRTLYPFSGVDLTIAGERVTPPVGVFLKGDADVEIVNGHHESELLLLQGRPIGEPVVQHGPFVMNTREVIAQAFRDYQRTQFGGWPWKRNDPVHPENEGRFAKDASGKVTKPDV
ncbi:MAG: pirin family protein [Deltaproteobacteria bacterium]